MINAYNKELVKIQTMQIIHTYDIGDDEWINYTIDTMINYYEMGLVVFKSSCSAYDEIWKIMHFAKVLKQWLRSNSKRKEHNLPATK